MFRGARIAAVVPAYREEAHIARVIETMPSTMKLMMIIEAKTGRLMEVSEIHI